MPRLTFVALLLALAVPLAAQTPTVLTCYKANKIGTATIDDNTPYTTDDGSSDGIKVQLSRLTLTVFSDSTYTLEFRFKGKKMTTSEEHAHVKTESGRIRSRGHDRNGQVLALYKDAATTTGSILTFTSDGKLRYLADVGLVAIMVPNAGACA